MHEAPVQREPTYRDPATSALPNSRQHQWLLFLSAPAPLGTSSGARLNTATTHLQAVLSRAQVCDLRLLDDSITQAPLADGPGTSTALA